MMYCYNIYKGKQKKNNGNQKIFYLISKKKQQLNK